MKKIILIFFISILLFLHLSLIKNYKFGITVMNYLNISINGQASNEFKLKNAEERLYGITSKAKCIYSYRPPKVIFDGNIIWSILGFIIIKEFTLNKELFCC